MCWPHIFGSQTSSDLKCFLNLNPHIMTGFCLFLFFIYFCVCAGISVFVWLQQTNLLRGLEEMGVGASINTVSMEAHWLSDPLVNFQGGCRGHQRGRRSAFMLITNNALLCPQHREETVATEIFQKETLLQFIKYTSYRRHNIVGIHVVHFI